MLALAGMSLLAGFILFPAVINFYSLDRDRPDKLRLVTAAFSVNLAAMVVGAALVLNPLTPYSWLAPLHSGSVVLFSINNVLLVWLVFVVLDRVALIPFILLVAVLALRAVLWFTTDLVWRHEIRPDRIPVNGPLREPFALAITLLTVVCVVAVLTKPSRSEFARKSVLIALAPLVILVTLSRTVSGPIGYYLVALSFVPPFLILQVFFFTHLRLLYRRTELAAEREKRLTQFGTAALAETTAVPVNGAVQLLVDVLGTPSAAYSELDQTGQPQFIASHGDITRTFMDRDTVKVPVEANGRHVGELQADIHREAEQDAAFVEAVGFALSASFSRSELEEELHRSLRARGDELELEVAERTSQLQRSNEDLARFAYIASHDLQAPLRTVNGFFHVFMMSLDQTSLTAEQLRFASEVNGGVERMQQLIRDLLAYSRIQMKPRVRVSIEAMAREVAAMLAGDLARLNATLRITATDDVLADPGQLRQVLQNLTQNALDHRSPDRDPKIVISSRRAESTVEVAVADNGKGIDPQFHERIFDMFKQVVNGPGTGIGLAVVKRVLEFNGTTPTVESDGASGTTFRFTLPAA